MRFLTFCLLAALAVVHVAQAKNVAVIIGGYGGGNSVEVITDGKVGVDPGINLLKLLGAYLGF
jgi:hypothetical protein